MNLSGTVRGLDGDVGNGDGSTVDAAAGVVVVGCGGAGAGARVAEDSPVDEPREAEARLHRRDQRGHGL